MIILKKIVKRRVWVSTYPRISSIWTNRRSGMALNFSGHRDIAEVQERGTVVSREFWKDANLVPDADEARLRQESLAALSGSNVLPSSTRSQNRHGIRDTNGQAEEIRQRRSRSIRTRCFFSVPQFERIDGFQCRDRGILSPSRSSTDRDAISLRSFSLRLDFTSIGLAFHRTARLIVSVSRNKMWRQARCDCSERTVNGYSRSLTRC